MRALAYFGKNDIRFTTEITTPVLTNPDDVLIDVEWCGICGTDLHEFTEGPVFFPEEGQTNEISGNGLPQAMGHEISGVVKAVGSSVTTLVPGDHVVVEPTGTCQDRAHYGYKVNKKQCSACEAGLHNICEYLGLCGCGVQSGGFAEKVCISERHCFKIPDWIPLDIAALIQPLAVCWHALKVAEFKKDSSALILGGGPIGLGMIIALQSFGCKSIVLSEPADIRRGLAQKMGVQTVNPLDFHESVAVEKIREMAPGQNGFNFSFDCSGVERTLHASVRCLAYRGTAVNVAMWDNKPVQSFPMDITRQEKKYTGSMCYTIDDFKDVVEDFKKGNTDVDRVAHMITAKVSLEDGLEKAFMRLLNDKKNTIKVLLTPKRSLV